MPAYVLARKDCDDGDLPVVEGDCAGNREAIAVFTGRSLAERYLRDAGGHLRLQVREVTAFELFDLFVGAHQDGVPYILVNPQPGPARSEDPSPVLVVEQQIADFAERLTREVMARGLKAAMVPHSRRRASPAAT